MKFSKIKFSGHQSFPLRNTWLTKGVISCNEDPDIFKQDYALVTLGVGKNMVDSIKYWCLATQVLEIDPENRRKYHLRPTTLGNKIFLEDGGWDPYLEDEGTLWLLHYLLATNPEWASTVYLSFNEMAGLEFTRNSLKQFIDKLLDRNPKWSTSENTIERDLNVFFRMYVGSPNKSRMAIEDSLDCPLAELGLIHEDSPHRTYAFARGSKGSLPEAIVLYAIWNYAQFKQGQSTFTFDELAYQPLSPGRVFKLDEPALAERLEHLTRLTSNVIQLTETAGYRQVVVSELSDSFSLEMLSDYYTQRLGRIS